MTKNNNTLVEKSKHLTQKVVLGYFLFAIFAFGSIFYILNIMKVMSSDDGADEEHKAKKHLITRVISLLNESSSIGQPLGMTEEYLNLFNEMMDETNYHLNELRDILTDSLHIQGIDTIEVLIENKRANTLQLYSLWQDMNKEKAFNKYIKTPGIDTITQVGIKEQVKIKKDSVIIERKNKGFFKRLADAFVPPKEEVGIVINTTSDIEKDTTHNVYNVLNKQVTALKEFQEDFEKERKQINFQLYDKAAELRHNDVLINTQINQILYAIEEEETAASMARIDAKQALYKDSTRILGVVAIIAIIVIFGFLIIIYRDISRSRYYRLQLEKAKQYAEELLIKQEKFMLAVSHDIRAPMSSILGYVELLLRRNPDDRQRYYLENMVGSSNHILSLVNDLLDFHRLDSGKMEIQKVSFNVRMLFEDIYHSFKPIADAKNLNFRLEMHEEGMNKTYSGDTIRIRQITSNLLSNAIKFTQEGEVVLSVDIHEGLLNFAVRDTGPGIPEDEQTAIFGEFTRLKNEKKEGFGLGLSITRKLVELMNGSIQLNSKPGKGSIFEIELPIDEIVYDDLSVTADSACEKVEELKVDGCAIKCLLVDDDPLQLALTEELLKQNGMTIVACSDPHKVLPLIESNTFDIVISDIQMPGIDGFELVKLIRDSGIEGTDKLPVIALSASVANDREFYKHAGFTGFLNKPFTANELISVLNTILATDFTLESKLNISSLTDFAAGDQSAMNMILDTFVKETSDNIALLKATINETNRVKASKIAHKMIPVFSMIGANHLVQHLRLLEKNDDELTDDAWLSLITEVVKQSSSVINQVLQQVGKV